MENQFYKCKVILDKCDLQIRTLFFFLRNFYFFLMPLYGILCVLYFGTFIHANNILSPSLLLSLCSWVPLLIPGSIPLTF